MRKLLLISVLFAAVVTAAQVQKQGARKRKLPEASIIWDGNQLHKLCQSYKGADKFPLGAGCSFYISGAAQTLVLNDDEKSSVLRQPGKGVTNEQVVDVVVKWLEEQPENRQLPAPYIIMESLNKAFPCE